MIHNIYEALDDIYNIELDKIVGIGISDDAFDGIMGAILTKDDIDQILDNINKLKQSEPDIKQGDKILINHIEYINNELYYTEFTNLRTDENLRWYSIRMDKFKLIEEDD